MKTPEEVEHLKNNWRMDACWDLELTEGFEEYYDELRAYRIQWQTMWAAESRIRLEEFARTINLEDNLSLAAYLLGLQQRVVELQEERDCD